MDPIDFFNNMNVFLIFFISLITLSAASFICYRFGKKSRKHTGLPSEFITNNILGLLALILGFSFSLVLERFEFRRGLGMDELNNISTAYQQAKVIRFKDPEKVQQLFKQYVEMRINSHKNKTPDEAIKEMIDLKAEIWKTFLEVAQKDRGDIESTYMESLTDMFQTANRRFLVMMKMLPPTFYLIILTMATLAIGLMNFDRGSVNDTRHMRTMLFIFSFSMIFTFIFDIDHSKSGFVQIKDPLLILKSILASH